MLESQDDLDKMTMEDLNTRASVMLNKKVHVGHYNLCKTLFHYLFYINFFSFRTHLRVIQRWASGFCCIGTNQKIQIFFNWSLLQNKFVLEMSSKLFCQVKNSNHCLSNYNSIAYNESHRNENGCNASYTPE